MKKRILSLLIASCVMGSLVGCSTGGDKKTETNKTTQTSESGINFNEAPYTISLSYPVYGSVQPDLQKVFDKVNEITLKKINAKVELKIISISNMANAYSLAASSGEKSDLISIIPGGNYFQKYASTKMIKPFDTELDKYGKDIKAAFGDTLEAAKYQGKQYGIPAKETAINGNGMYLLKSIVDKYNIDVTKIKTLNDFDEVFAKVKAGEPDMQVFFPVSVNYFLNFETAGGGFGVLKNNGLDDLKLVNLYETEEYISAVKKMREWYMKGYITKDYATTQVQPSSIQNVNKLFAIPNTINFDNANIGENPPKVTVMFKNPIKTTDELQKLMWVIPSSSERPDKTIQFLNLTFQDQELAKLMKYGIEGEHYDVVKEGVVDVNKGIKTYRQPWNIWGDSVTYPIMQSALLGVDGDVAKYKTALTDWNKNTKSSKALGFMFNPDPVKTEVAALSSIGEQYGKLLEGGALDPDKELKNFIDKLNAAGAKKVMEEKQKQLDEWAKTK